jgi:hypothetical protein
MIPPKNIVEKYSKSWFEKFKNQANIYLNDINYQNPYYYCIASLASKNYIHGYPKSNPICS